jgi:hypothetical protein
MNAEMYAASAVAVECMFEQCYSMPYIHLCSRSMTQTFLKRTSEGDANSVIFMSLVMLKGEGLKKKDMFFMFLMFLNVFFF